MKFNKNTLIPVIISAIFLFSSVSAMINTYEKLTYVLFLDSTDTTDNPPSFTIPADASAMFNERGFYKSNSVSFDENEIISDYNGNLIYSFPIGYSKGPGDMYLDLKMTYNGSMNYQVVAANLAWANFTNMPQYNMTTSGWVLSVNGMAVQMLNFETNMFTKGTSSAETNIYNKDVRLLATGYQLTDGLRQVSGNPRDVILIMQGDGSVINLKNINPNCSSENNFEQCYIGDYYADNKGSYVRAKVEYIEDYVWNEYRNRRASVMMGDGLTYIYEEYKNQYYDYPYNTGSWFLRPQVFLLRKIKDRYGNMIEFSYSSNLYIYGGSNTAISGRPLFTGLSGSWIGGSASVQYSVAPYGMAVTSSSGRYKMVFSTYGFSYGDLHRPQILELINPYGDKCTFQYENYHRSAIELRNPYSGSGNNYYNMNLNFNSTSGGLDRIMRVTNYNKGIREYTYIGLSGSNTAIDMSPTNENKIQSADPNFYGQGRDAFFNNMISSKITKDNTVQLSQENFSYHYADDNSGDRLTNPVDERDVCQTIREKTSLNSAYDYETPTVLSTRFTYKNYKLIQYQHSVENPDWPGETKLVKEEHYESNSNNIHRSVDYEYSSSGSGGGIYSGSFLPTKTTEHIGTAVREYTFEYEHYNENIGVDQEDQPLHLKIEKDPFNLEIKTTYNSIIYEKSIHYKYAKYDPYQPLNNQDIDTTFVYLINLPVTVEKYKGSTLKYKEEMSYVSSNDSEGYIGQIKNSKVFDIQNMSNFQQTQYKYYHNDTTGIFIYTIDGTKPGNEGNLKAIIDPKGDTTNYYYHPVLISPSDPVFWDEGLDAPVIPKLKLKKAMDNRTLSEEYRQWEDKRLPTRIDSYASPGRYVSNFMLYDDKGNVSQNVNSNDYLSEFAYDDLGRVRVIVLPYDFDNSVVQDSVDYDTNYVQADYTLLSIIWGNINLLTNTVTRNDGWYNIESVFKTNFHDMGGNGGSEDNITTNLVATAEFNPTAIDAILNKFQEIQYAKLEYYPTLYDHNIGGDTDRTLFKVKIRSLSALTINSYTLTSYNSIGSIFSPVSGVDCLHFQGENVYPTMFLDYYNVVDVTNIFQSHLAGQIPFRGFVFDKIAYVTNPNEYPAITFNLDIGRCVFVGNQGYWPRPTLKIGGLIRDIDTIIIKKYNNSTFKYVYDDDKNITSVNAKIDKPGSNFRYKRTDMYFDGFYRVWKTRTYPNAFTSLDSNVFTNNYNYLDQKARTVDAKGSKTMFSYNKYGNLAKTENEDESENFISDTFYDTLTTAYYTISSGFVNRKTYTDETGRLFYKYFDAAGNLLREFKTVAGDNQGNIQNTDDPYDPDTTFSGQDVPSQQIALVTDYKYDDLYRVIEVKTPAGKLIKYQYDGLGRQSQRETPDAGITKYYYDYNNNLTYSQDELQRGISTSLYTLRTYDGMNRLLTLSQETTTDPNQQEDNPTSGNVFTVNCYDSLAYTPLGSIFTNVPSDYYSSINNTKGAIVATAYRTLLTDGWSYKFYRYDARGRVIRFWHYINGLGWKTVNYAYNSQNQITSNSYQPGLGDGKTFSYSYDDAARLIKSNLYIGSHPEDPEQETDAPSSFYQLAGYVYNNNSQDSLFSLNNNQYVCTYSYNNRNWVTVLSKQGSNPVFAYGLTYNPNGNIRKQSLGGSYRNVLNNTDNLIITHIYDQSNRLLKSDKDSGSVTTSFDIINNYDKDGNFVNMKRYGSSDNLVDNFIYSYVYGTNRLQNLSVAQSDYTYDNNGNVIVDQLNHNSQMKYDYRNLLIENLNNASEFTFKTKYYYDEAGNRVRKLQYLYVNGTPPNEEDLPPGHSEDTIIVDEGDGNGYWSMTENIFYVRDISGKEVAVYSGSSLTQWNIWGLDQVGHMNSDTTKYYYLKDHLGSVRCVLNSTNTVVSAQDYDAWGYLMENRSYQTENSKYKFTGKERDKDLENNYDYFGARYYDSRVATWGSVDPRFEKHIQWTPYNYVLRSPLILFDPDGMQDYYILKFFSNVLDEAVSVVRSANNINMTPWSMFLSIVLNPQSFGYAELKDMKRFYPGAEGYLEYPNELAEITVTALRNEGGIYIPDEDKVADDMLNPPEERGLAPTSKETGQKVEIHHIGQKSGGPYKEIFEKEHRGPGKYKQHHDPKKPSEREKNWSNMVKKYWKKEWDSGRFDK